MRVSFDPVSAMSALRDDMRAAQAPEVADAIDAALATEYPSRSQQIVALYNTLQESRDAWETRLSSRRREDVEALMERLRVAMHGVQQR